jgi:hypothetical protein
MHSLVRPGPSAGAIARRIFAITWVAVSVAAGLHAFRYAVLGLRAVFTLRVADTLLAWLNHDHTQFFARFSEQQHPRYGAHRTAVYAHILFVAMALAVGSLQFLPGLRARFRRVHRSVGMFYLLCSTLGGICGSYMAVILPMAGDWAAVVANVAAGVLVVGFNVMAILSARKRSFSAHRAWTIRSFSMLFTLVTLYGLLFALCALGLATARAYELSHYAAVPINWVLAEIVVHCCPHQGSVADSVVDVHSHAPALP